MVQTDVKPEKFILAYAKNRESKGCYEGCKPIGANWLNKETVQQKAVVNGVR